MSTKPTPTPTLGLWHKFPGHMPRLAKKKRCGKFQAITLWYIGSKFPDSSQWKCMLHTRFIRIFDCLLKASAYSFKKPSWLFIYPYLFYWRVPIGYTLLCILICLKLYASPFNKFNMWDQGTPDFMGNIKLSL